MFFWFFSLFVNLIIPLVMLIFGKLFIKSVPDKINTVYGYRTPMSMKNQDTWQFAHSYCGKIWIICGGVLLVITVATMLALIGKSQNIIGMAAAIICIVQLAVLICSVIPTEKALKKNFDKYGNRL